MMGMLGEDTTYEVAACSDDTEEASDDGIAPELEVTYVRSPVEAPATPTVVVSQALRTATAMFGPRW